MTIKPRLPRRTGASTHSVEGAAGPILATSWAWSPGDQGDRGLFELLPFEQAADWPVCVSLAEARAYAR